MRWDTTVKFPRKSTHPLVSLFSDSTTTPGPPLALAFHNLLIQDIDAIMMYYWDTDNYLNGAPVLLPDNRLVMARILARLTLLLTGADAYLPHIINSVWGDDKNARLALGGP
jgi:hypothetical protein